MISQSNQQERRRHRYDSEWSISTANLPASYSTDMKILVLLLLSVFSIISFFSKSSLFIVVLNQPKFDVFFNVSVCF